MAEKETQTVEETKAEQEPIADAEHDSDEAVEAEAEVVGSKDEQLEAQINELNNRLLRTQADYDNFRRRSREEKEAAAKYRSQVVIESLLPVLDNFERALLVNPESDETKSLLQGMEMVYRQLQDTLNNEGVAVIETEGQTFDPHLHQAVMQVEEDGFESGQIVEELQKGYKLKDRVLRPAMVKVNA
ncbi:nucleotide exchange factor GrpE [Halalkalibacter sp. APA_J-10(15)]|uniref:nucleotide exchange factor GrpE n=1 Tax=Halalkalibacter sp. APA_J-10(15) TaxID=2933805 RepID=UPI001FF4814C|nr:nucleotide exchange factor GrpE [Halalkalibacter sp. APA_J-10(15)]MCK0471605.1 nucleotide exchange factor GrpE [Halalkalibacter sp. APA_J-10(15)]